MTKRWFRRQRLQPTPKMFEMSRRFEFIAFREFRLIGNFSEKKRDAGFEPGEHSQLHRLCDQAADQGEFSKSEHMVRERFN